MKRMDTPESPLPQEFTLPARLGWREQAVAGLLLALAALILAPTFYRGLACGHDTLTHFYRVVQVALNAQNGAPFSLWSPDFMRGYGYAIFPFYAPLTYWGTAVLHFLGLDFSPALRLAAWLMLWLAGWGGYNLARRYVNPTGAMIAGLAYLFAPYLLYNATQRGAFPELLGLALLPWALAAADVALVSRSRRAVVTAVSLFSPLVLAHNIIPNLGFVLLMGLAIGRSRGWSASALWSAIRPALVVMALTLAVTAFFWLPAYVELGFTQTRRADSPFASWPSYEQHFTGWRQMAGWPEEPGDPALTNPPISVKIGAGTAVLALLAVALGIGHGRYRRPWLWLWTILTLGCLFLASPSSGWWWARLPLPEFVQLPSRFFGPASLGTAVLAGVAGEWLAGRWSRRWVGAAFFAACAFGVSLSGWFWLYPAVCPAPAAPTAVTVAQSTLWDETGGVQQWGGDSLGETLPRWVDKLPEPNALMAAYEAGEPVNRLELPQTAVLQTWQPQANGDQFHLRLSEPITLTYRAFYSPYWRAEVNRAPAALTPRSGDGLIQLALPAGDVDLLLAFGPTSLRWAMLLASGLAAVIVLGWGWRRGAETAVLPGPSRGMLAIFLAVIVALWLMFVLVDRRNNRIHTDRLQDGRLAAVSHPAQLSFGGELMYLGYNGPDKMAAGETAVFTHYWRAQHEIGVPYGIDLRLADEAGNVWNLPPARPSSYADLPGKPGWQVDGYARDAYELRLLPGTPPGVYWLETGAFRRDIDLALLPEGAATGVNPALARVGQVQVGAGDGQIEAANAQVDTFAPVPVAGQPGLTLLGWSVPEVVWRPGEVAGLDLLWQGEGAVAERPFSVDVRLVDAAGVTAAQQAVLVGGANYPLAQWPETAVVRDQVQWRLPAGLASGRYTVELVAAGQVIGLGEWQIEAPPHDFTPPVVAETAVLTTSFASLWGYGWGETAVFPGDTVALELVWQALDTADVSYRVFVHLLDASGNLVAQSDAVPDAWTRPTTGWLRGEFIHDRHHLTLPADVLPGTYTLRVGWYETGDGRRAGEAVLGHLWVGG
ncbi:MAG: 6-pyruvoyl-tetrahydropterin synthase-related protein [Candidatus Promineifilaceae bacterium]